MATYQDNLLNDYDNYTYNWKITLIDPTNPASGGVVLAESGVENELSIESVAHDYNFLFHQSNRSTDGNLFNITLREPNGLSLYPRIAWAARLVTGSKNWMEAGYRLSFKCVGWQNGNPVNPIPGTEKEWITMLRFVGHDFDGGASTYNLMLAEIKETAYELLDHQIPEEIKITARTLGEFASRLQERINKSSVDMTRLEKDRLLPTTYTISYPGDWNSQKFAAANSDSSTGAGRMVSNNGDALNFDFPVNTQISMMLNLAYLHTEQGRMIETRNGGNVYPAPTGSDYASADAMAGLPIWIGINPSVEFIGYDTLANKYQRNITYEVVKYITPEIKTDSPAQQLLLGSTALQQTRLNNIVANNLLRKRYDYYYTGLNTEVLNFDIQLNNAYYMLSSIAQGNTSEQRNVGTPSSANDIRFLAEQIANLQAEKDRLEAEIDADQNVTPNNFNVKQLESLNRQIIALDQLATQQNNSLTSGGDSGDGVISGEIYIDQEMLNSDDLQELTINNTRYHYHPFNSLATNGPDSGIDGDAAAVRLGVTEFSLSSLRELQNIQIQVRGDPYWIGAGHEDFKIGGPYFYLKVNLPTYTKDGSTTAEPDPDWNISGLYRVYQVKSVCQGGQWVMTLTAYRDPHANVKILYSNLETGELRSVSDINQLMLEEFADDRDTVREKAAKLNPRGLGDKFNDTIIPPGTRARFDRLLRDEDE